MTAMPHLAMRRLSSLIVVVLLAGAAPTFADPHAEMAAALAAQIDAHPARATLPGPRTLPQTATTQVGRACPQRVGDKHIYLLT